MRSARPSRLPHQRNHVWPGQYAVVFFIAVNIRKFVLRAARLDDLVGLGSLSPRAATFLDASVRAGLNILIAGSTQAGKTTLLTRIRE
ncbi:MAG: Flp pilus assembly complex ATPase component TadA [Actinobacteria bacterium]|nr:Flp pilus assembly complex ATPase component TadA [Actinomycetota bacterium]